MSFKPGDAKPKTSGRTKGTPNKKKLLRITDYVKENGINIAETIWLAIQEIDVPDLRVKALIQYYKFLEPEAKDPITDEAAEQEEEIDLSTIGSTVDRIMRAIKD